MADPAKVHPCGCTDYGEKRHPALCSAHNRQWRLEEIARLREWLSQRVAEMPRLLCPTCGKGALYYARRPEFIDKPIEYVECDSCHEIFQLECRG
jgi:hypothetical protein